MSQKINEILEHLEKACTIGTKARANHEITGEEYDIINETIAMLENQVRSMGQPKMVRIAVTMGCPSGSTSWGNLSWSLEVEENRLDIIKDHLADFMNELGA